MANSMGNDMPPQWAPEEDTKAGQDDTTLNLGHAGLARECWPGPAGGGSDVRTNVIAALRRPALRLQRSARPCTRRCPRPFYPAEARFTAVDIEFLTQ